MKILLILLLLGSYTLSAQHITGSVFNSESNLPLAYVNIGIAGKNTGTVSDENGLFDLDIDPQLLSDTLLFTSIGYAPYSIKIADYLSNNKPRVYLQEKLFAINEVYISSKPKKQITLGITSKSKSITAGFSDNKLGYECGIKIKVKEEVWLKNIKVNIASCTYDSVFYRLNIYRERAKSDFENILSEPIYIKATQKDTGDFLVIDVKSRNLVLNEDFLITLEHVKNLGQGDLFFSAKLGNKTYYRKTSHANWETAPAGISIAVDASIDK